MIVSETLFGMDGDALDVKGVLGELGEGDVLLLDEAHALGVLGPQGRGLAYEYRDPRIVIVGTLSKAFGAQGGFVAGPGRVVELLVNVARTFLFDTALAPALACAARESLRIVRASDDRRAHLLGLAAKLRDGLIALGFTASGTVGPVVPVHFGTERAALEAAARLLERGVAVPAIRPPTVPPGTSRLRVGVRSDHRESDIDRLLSLLPQCIAIS
ncbi:MAG: aminotransferase class I/II-fold pyridoxal phosphate-dependent enzyme [Candidatus Eremiobacteraeota bacterium]|nr:aminotransferase class I/II-fold pyridoxal phosphate-dependent enzyme [Candidatus Eremiobacteraeota bacterium]